MASGRSPSWVQGGYKRFTASRLASLPAGRYADPAQQGLYLLVRNRKADPPSRTWLHRIVFRGADTFLTLGTFPRTSLADARAEVQAQRELLTKGIDPRRAAPRRRQIASTPNRPTTTGDPHSIETLAAEFMQRFIVLRRKDPEYVRRQLNNDVLPAWKGRDARTITPREVIDLLDRIVESGNKVKANRLASLLGQLFKFGLHRNIVNDSPVKLLFRPGGKEKPRSRTLSDAELTIFLKDPTAATRFDRLAHCLKILLMTGQRRGELALARWREIDFEAKTWRIPDQNSKTGIGHTVPLSDWALEEFGSLQRLAGGSAYVVPNEAGDAPADPKLITRGVSRCKARLSKIGIAEFTPHDLRRTVRTGLARLGVRPDIAERVLNHAQEAIAGTYDTHDYLEEKRQALVAWDAHLRSLRDQ